MGVGDNFGYLRKVLIIPKMREMGQFLTQNQHFSSSLEICSTDFSEIIPNGRH